MRGSQAIRPKRQYTRKAKVAGELATGGLADIQPITSKDWRDHFEFHPTHLHVHKWLFGDMNAVCSRCGKTVGKHETHLY